MKGERYRIREKKKKPGGKRTEKGKLRVGHTKKDGNFIRFRGQEETQLKGPRSNFFKRTLADENSKKISMGKAPHRNQWGQRKNRKTRKGKSWDGNCRWGRADEKGLWGKRL